MKFFIKQNSTLPTLKFPLTQKLMEKYNITDEMMENVAVTFSMVTSDGFYKIANKAADLYIKEDITNELIREAKYTLIYKFSKRNTKKYGNYYGEFKLDFLGETCGKITLPNNNMIDIYIDKSITNTDVI